MNNRALGAAALACLAVAGVLFLSRLLGIVGADSLRPAYHAVYAAFVWTFGPGIALADAYLVRTYGVFRRARTPALRSAFKVGAFLALLVPGAVLLVVMSVGMNFMGQ